MPLEQYTFFVDRSLGSLRLAGALRDLGLTIVVHDDLFAQDALDPDWLRMAGDHGWVVLTKDDKIRYRPIERDAYLRAGVRCFVFTQGNQRMDVIIHAFRLAMEGVDEILVRVEAPFVARITASGDVAILAPPEKRDPV